MSLWEFGAVIGGVSKMNGGGGEERLSREEADSLGALVLEHGHKAH